MINNLSNLIKTREKILIPKYAVCSNFWNITREWKQNLSCICCCSGFKRFVTIHSDFFNFQKEKYRFPWNVFTFSQYQHHVCLFKGTFRSLVRQRWVLCIHLLLKLQSYNLESNLQQHLMKYNVRRSRFEQNNDSNDEMLKMVKMGCK